MAPGDLLRSAERGSATERVVAARLLASVVERLERDAWRACKAEGLSWSDLALVTGLTRSGAQMRAASLDRRDWSVLTGSRSSPVAPSG